MLFGPFQQRDVVFRNRIALSPICQYSAPPDGLPNDWHLAHLVSRAVGGAGLIIAEASGVSPEGRITNHCTGIWNEAQAAAWQRIVSMIGPTGAQAGLQLAHAGRKASCETPPRGGRRLPLDDPSAWIPVAPSAVAPYPEDAVPAAADAAALRKVVSDFRNAARLALDSGFGLVEIHAAHGYLLHEFLSPLSNQRDDAYGGSFENRIRLTLEVAAAVRAVWPERLPLWVRVSATDWVEGGWEIEQSVELCRRLAELGVDLIDVSSGGLIPTAIVPAVPNYQVDFAARIRREAAVATGAGGLINDAAQAEAILAAGDADMILMARQLMRSPYFPLAASRAADQPVPPPVQYIRAFQ